MARDAGSDALQEHAENDVDDEQNQRVNHCAPQASPGRPGCETPSVRRLAFPLLFAGVFRFDGWSVGAGRGVVAERYLGAVRRWRRLALVGRWGGHASCWLLGWGGGASGCAGGALPWLLLLGFLSGLGSGGVIARHLVARQALWAHDHAACLTELFARKLQPLPTVWTVPDHAS